MSGVVNMVTRDGGPKFEGSISELLQAFILTVLIAMATKFL